MPCGGVGDGLDSSIQGRPGLGARRGEVEVVQKRDQAVVRVKGGSRAVQGIVLTQGKQCRGQRVALFAAFALLDFAAPPLVVPPAVGGGPAIKKKRTNGSSSGATSCSLVRNAALDMQSYALRPSSDTSTASGRSASAARTWAAKASVPARACSAN